MKGTPLNGKDPEIVTRANNLGLKLVPNVLKSLTMEALSYYEQHLDQIPDALKVGFNSIPLDPVIKKMANDMVCKLRVVRSINPNLRDWLRLRGNIHHFLTGESVNLLEMFNVKEDLLTSTDFIPVFRPAGATNRMAVNWKVNLGMDLALEESDVMLSRNAYGSSLPTLHLIQCSTTPDEESMAVTVSEILSGSGRWLDIYGWLDADNLHFLMKGTHLDSSLTATIFPNEHLRDNWYFVGLWHDTYDRPNFRIITDSHVVLQNGGRSAISVPLREKSK